MRARLLVAIFVLVADCPSACAQEADEVAAPILPTAASQAETGGWWGSGEYLLWWTKTGDVPPLGTAGGDGVIGSAGTRVVLDDLDFADDVRHGGRFTLGYDFDAAWPSGVEASYFFLADAARDVRFASDGPVLGRPYIDVTTGRPAATLIAAPGQATGSMTIESRTSLQGAEANLVGGRLIGTRSFHLTALGGLRFLRLEDELGFDEQFVVDQSVPEFGGSVVELTDEFRTLNSFYGAQVGVLGGWRSQRWTIDFRSKFALGQMHHVADVDGTTNSLAPDGTLTVFEGGLLALRTNMGRHQWDELAFIPEVDLDIGWHWTRHLRLFAGYSFVWVGSVALAGEQIDPVINESVFPILSGNGPLVGPARPVFPFVESDYRVHGLNFGVEVRW